MDLIKTLFEPLPKKAKDDNNTYKSSWYNVNYYYISQKARDHSICHCIRLWKEIQQLNQDEKYVCLAK